MSKKLKASLMGATGGGKMLLGEGSATNAIAQMVEEDFSAFCRKRGLEDQVDDVTVLVEGFGEETALSFNFAADDGRTYDVAGKSYLKALKKRFQYFSNGEGEEYVVSLVIPTICMEDFVSRLKGTSTAEMERIFEAIRENSSKAKLAKKFNTVAFSGALTVSRKEAVRAAKAAGLKVATTVTKDVDCVVMGRHFGTKVDQAEALRIPVISEAEWNRQLKKLGRKR